jgi:nucleoside diphosphate kinase
MVGEIISRYEHLGLKLVFMKMIMLDENTSFYNYSNNCLEVTPPYR